MEKIFFQSSLPRSGSTLLQNIIGQNPDFYVTPTSGVLELLYASRLNFTNSSEFKAQDQETMKSAFASYCKAGLEGFYNGIPEAKDKKYIMDKSRGWGIHQGFLNTFYPGSKIICMVRDIRAIFASMEKNFQKNQHIDSGIVNHAEMSGTTTEKRVNIWANSQPVGLAIERLYQIIREGKNYNILFVKFEQLTRNPQDTLNQIYDYLEVPKYTHDFNNVQQITQEDDAVYGIYGDHKIKKEVKPLIDNYNDVLGVDISNSIKHSFKWFFDYFNYVD